MAVTRTYSIEAVREVAFDGGGFSSDAAVASFGDPNQNASFVTAAQRGAGVALQYYNPDGQPLSTFTYGGFNPSVAALGPDTTFLAIETGDGEIQVLVNNPDTLTTYFPTTFPGSNPDVAAGMFNSGGAAVVYQRSFGATDNDIYLTLRNSIGNEIFSQAIDASAANDTNASVAYLRDRGIVVAWQRKEANGDTAIWFATFNGDGSVRTQAREYDGVGSINRDPQVAASPEGGFVITYVDDEAGGTELATFTESGDGRSRTYTVQTNLDTVSDSATTAIGQNGSRAYATAFTRTIFDNGEPRDEDLYFVLTDPNTGKALIRPVALDVSDAVWRDPSIATIGGSGGEFVITVSDETNGVVRQFVKRVVETAKGDDRADSIFTTLGGRLVADGGGGNDFIQGGNFNDRLSGGEGDDKFIATRGDDYFNGGAGVDIVQMGSFGSASRVDLRLTSAQDTGQGRHTFIGIENLRGISTVDDTFIGTDGNNVLDGGGNASAPFPVVDDFAGGLGDDTYIVGDTNDIVREAANAGLDTVKAWRDYTLSANVENLELIDDGQALKATGNGLANRISGNQFGNRLDGRAGADVMIGGAGADVYVVDDAGDRVVEANVAGVDQVESSVSYRLGAYVENLTLTGDAAINGTGNALSNAIIGNSAANTINGGAGVDLMQGGGGADTYNVDNPGDVIFEENVAGVDLVRSSASFTLFDFVENLELTGTANLAGTGNGAANRLTGNAGKNTLDGRGGVDTMVGGAGDDTYYVDDARDQTIEAADAGRDTVVSTVSLTLRSNVEDLRLGGPAAINGTGNTLANVITGNDAANTLNGGLGVDRLTGGLGADTFVFNTAVSDANLDYVLDFNVADDTIALENAVFTGLRAGALAAGAFRIGQAAADADDRVIYNSTLGRLYFDVDGVGGEAQQQFAIIGTGVAMTESDFRVV